jgi:ferredoxin
MDCRSFDSTSAPRDNGGGGVDGDKDDSSSSSGGALAYLRSLPDGVVPARLHGGILRAVRSAYGRQAVAEADLRALGEDGIAELARAVAREEEEEEGDEGAGQQQRHAAAHRGGRRRPVIELSVAIPHHATTYERIKWRLGESLLNVSKNYPDELGEYMEGTCGGQMSCCTCHIYLPTTLATRLESLGLGVSEAEQDMLDLAYDPDPERSRLGCQVVLTESLVRALDENSQGIKPLTITLPSGVNNVWK